MSRRIGYVTGCLVVAAAVTLGVWRARVGDGTTVETADVPLALSGVAAEVVDVSTVLPRRVPQIAVDGTTLVVYSGTDFELDQTETVLMVSEDGGAGLRTLPFDEPLAEIGVVVHRGNLTLLGKQCEPPDDPNDAVCDTENATLEAYVVNLRSGSSRRLPRPPIEGAVVGPVGVTEGRPAFLIATSDGAVVLSTGAPGAPDGWQMTSPPGGASGVCSIDGRLVAVASSAPLDVPAPTDTASAGNGDAPPTQPPAGVPEVGAGEPLWTAATSDDGGVSWSDPEPFLSELPRDFSFELGVVCGPSQVVVHTAQMGVFDPDAGQWQRIALPPELQGQLPPGTAATWAAPDRLVIWTLPVEPSPQASVDIGGVADSVPVAQFQVVEVAGIGTAAPTVAVTATVDASTGLPIASSPSAEANGYVVARSGDRVMVGRVG